MLKLWDLAFEIRGDEIDLEQDMGCGDVARITLHRVHLRHLAEQAGLIPATVHGDPDRAIARLSRQLRTLADRINHLDECIWAVSRMGHEDLDHECTYSLATWELAQEFVQDLDATDETHPKTGPLNTPENGTVSPGSGNADVRKEVTHGALPDGRARSPEVVTVTTPKASAHCAKVESDSTAQGELPLAAAAQPMANRCTTDGKPMADAMHASGQIVRGAAAAPLEQKGQGAKLPLDRAEHEPHDLAASSGPVASPPTPAQDRA